jgi:catechol 2,3-dioxygenase-like lactoylglutathione lyase family enzyme
MANRNRVRTAVQVRPAVCSIKETDDERRHASCRRAVRHAVSSGFLNLRVRDIAQAFRDWWARGATFLTEPKDHGYEIRAYIRDPDGHLIEVGQTT